MRFPTTASALCIVMIGTSVIAIVTASLIAPTVIAMATVFPIGVITALITLVVTRVTSVTAWPISCLGDRSVVGLTHALAASLTAGNFLSKMASSGELSRV